MIDTDLDGDNDLDDQYRVVLHGLSLANMNLGGSEDFFDVTIFIDLFNAGDPVADIAAPFGSLDTLDVPEFQGHVTANVCGSPQPCP